ncbi:translocation and assembly module TamB-like protein [Cyanobium sp. NS01]|nr:translocation and assembly module TamB-like protein [Cyanobium sp. NS01]
MAVVPDQNPGEEHSEAADKASQADDQPVGKRPLRVGRPTPLLLASVATMAATGVAIGSADALLAGVYRRVQPRLESTLGRALGHPLQLGPYRGLGWSGLTLGPSRVLPGPDDASTLDVRQLSLSLDPLASLRLRRPVLQLGLVGLEANLRRNAQGRYWVLPPDDPNAEPPRLDLRLRLEQPAQLNVAPAGVSLQVEGSADLKLHLETIKLRALVRPSGPAAGQDGSLRLVGEGNWGKQSAKAQLLSQGFPLQLPARFLGLPGSLKGDGSGRLTFSWRDGGPQCEGELQLQRVQWQAPGSNPPLSLREPRLRCRGQLISLPATSWRWGDFDGRVGLQARWQRQQLALDTLEVLRLNSWLRVRGELGKRLQLDGSWQLLPSELPQTQGTPPGLLGEALRGQLQVRGSWPRPQVEAALSQASNPVIGSWNGLLRWNGEQLRLERLRSAHLTASGSLPLRFNPGQPLRPGPLDLRLAISDFPLPKLSAAVGTDLEGVLNASGSIRGPLTGLTPDFALTVSSPGAGPLRVSETWSGDWFGNAAGGGRLAMRAVGTTEPATLEASLDRRWVPESVLLRRSGGALALRGSPRLYRWTADAFPLDGVMLTLGPRSQRQPLKGALSGAGELELQPLAFSGQASLDRPVLLGVWAEEASISGRYTERRYQARVDVVPLSGGGVAIDWSGRWKGPFQATVTGRELRDPLVRQLLEAWPLWQGEGQLARGTASDLGTFLIDTLGGSLDGQLAALELARTALQGARRDPLSGLTVAQRLEKLAGRFDLDATLTGPRLVDTRADLSIRAHLWLPGQDQDLALTSEPVQVTLQGPFRMGQGQLSLSGLPLALVALLTPVPETLRGRIAAQGRYSLGGADPELSLDFALEDGALGEAPLLLERGAVAVAGDVLNVDLALRAEGAESNVELAGQVPLNPAREGLELRLASRDDGLRFLTELARPELEWNAGGGDLQLLVRGSLDDPIANGFLRFRDAALTLVGQKVENLQATVLFDFEQLFLQEFTAQVGPQGSISGSGSLGLLEPAVMEDGEPSQLSLELTDVPFALPRVKAVAAGSLLVSGSLAALDIGGDLSMSKGTINVQPEGAAPAAGDSTTTVSREALQNWDFSRALDLLGPGVESRASANLRDLLPAASVIGFDDLRLSLGPDLTVVVPNLASFASEGMLRINGRLDPSLEARGVVRLKRGRLTLFTTTFSLDPEAPNVAVFTPSAGLIPFVDVALRTRVSDTLQVGGLGSGSLGPSLAELETQGGAGTLDQLNLVRVFLSVSGPADRLADTLELRSSPPLPQDRLLALIGGNSLAGLTEGGAGAALATVLGQTLLAPLLGNLSDAFDQRLSFALYPAYVTPTLSSRSERRSQQVPPQLVLGSEIGLDINERFNASVLAAPNRSDVAPQLNLNYKASDLINLQGSVDTQGVWQGQLQVFLRF